MHQLEGIEMQDSSDLIDVVVSKMNELEVYRVMITMTDGRTRKLYQHVQAYLTIEAELSDLMLSQPRLEALQDVIGERLESLGITVGGDFSKEERLKFQKKLKSVKIPLTNIITSRQIRMSNIL